MLINFDNGIKVHSKIINEAKTFICKLFILTGSSRENINKSGITHFCEHLIFKGPKDFKNSNEFALYLEKQGILINAFTSRDFICFELKSESVNALNSIRLLMDMLFNPSLRLEEFEKEREVILEELEYLVDDPEHLCRQELSKIVWGENHPLGRSVIGTKKSVSSLEINDIKKFLNENVVTNNFFFSLVGNFNKEEILSYIKEIPTKKHDNMKIDIDDFETNLINNSSHLERDSQVAYCCIGFKIKEWKKYDRWVYDVINYYVGEGISSRLFQNIREKHSLVYDIWSKASFYNHGSEFTIGYCTTIEKRDFAYKKVVEELGDLVNITYNDLDIAKKRFKTSNSFALDNFENYAYWMGRNFSISGKLVNMEKEFNAIDALSLDYFRDLIKETFNNNTMFTAQIGPEIQLSSH